MNPFHPTALQPFTTSLPARSVSPADQRQANRSLSRLAGQTGVELAQIEARAMTESARIDAVASIGQTALHSVAILTSMEQQLAQAVPLASGRLALIADLTAMSMADIVARAARKL